jgi:hypothetical protein
VALPITPKCDCPFSWYFVNANTARTYGARSGYDTIDILKIDIEGAERQIFSPDLRFEASLDHTRNLAIELHGDDCGRIFFAAMSAYDYDRSERDDVTICRNIRRKHIRTSIVASTAVSTAGSVTRGIE